jgi:hypothetical protein
VFIALLMPECAWLPLGKGLWPTRLWPIHLRGELETRDGDNVGKEAACNLAWRV